jgi:hypothetical protein
MNEIYTAAESVILWLGLADGDSDLTFKVINDGAVHGFSDDWMKAFFENIEWRKNDPVLEAVMEVLMREYWERLWIVQEIACATYVVVYCGDSTVVYQDINRFTDKLFRQEMEESRMYSRAARIVRMHIREFGLVGHKDAGSVREPEIYADPVWILARNAVSD